MTEQQDTPAAGRPALVAIVGNEPVMRATVITRTDERNYRTSQPWDTVVPRLLNFPESSTFQF